MSVTREDLYAIAYLSICLAVAVWMVVENRSNRKRQELVENLIADLRKTA